MEKLLLGAGCFWGVEHLLKNTKGILKTEVGYAGGNVENPTYPEVCSGLTNHAEVVLVEYDKNIIGTKEVLELFFRLHDPTTLNRQHNDIGTQYRSVIFYENQEQAQIARDFINEIDAKKIFKSPVVTTVEAIRNYFTAEVYHQDYLDKNPEGYMCHIMRDSL